MAVGGPPLNSLDRRSVRFLWRGGRDSDPRNRNLTLAGQRKTETALRRIVPGLVDEDGPDDVSVLTIVDCVTAIDACEDGVALFQRLEVAALQRLVDDRSRQAVRTLRRLDLVLRKSGGVMVARESTGSCEASMLGSSSGVLRPNSGDPGRSGLTLTWASMSARISGAGSRTPCHFIWTSCGSTLLYRAEICPASRHPLRRGGRRGGHMHEHMWAVRAQAGTLEAGPATAQGQASACPKRRAQISPPQPSSSMPPSADSEHKLAANAKDGLPDRGVELLSTQHVHPAKSVRAIPARCRTTTRTSPGCVLVYSGHRLDDNAKGDAEPRRAGS